LGLYDDIIVTGEWCRCSEGHDLSGEVFQTKDLGSTMGRWSLAEDLRGEFGGWGDAVSMPLSGTIAIYTSCPVCPAFLDLGTWNVLMAWVEFEVDLDANRLVAVWRISQPSAEWIESERAAGSIGPMHFMQAIAECKARRERG
jgi:hypothetical protein